MQTFQTHFIDAECSQAASLSLSGQSRACGWMAGEGLVARLQRMILVDCSMHACTVLSWWTVYVSAPSRNNRPNFYHQ